MAGKQVEIPDEWTALLTTIRDPNAAPIDRQAAALELQMSTSVNQASATDYARETADKMAKRLVTATWGLAFSTVGLVLVTVVLVVVTVAL